MPIRVRYKNDSSQECTIRPTPLVAISTNILKNGAGEAFGVTYSITLTGTLLPAEGTPYAVLLYMIFLMMLVLQLLKALIILLIVVQVISGLIGQQDKK